VTGGNEEYNNIYMVYSMKVHWNSNLCLTEKGSLHTGGKGKFYRKLQLWKWLD